MSVFQAQVTIPSNGTPIAILAGNTANFNQINIRNTGSNTVLIGPQATLNPPINIVLTPSGGGGTFAAGTFFWTVTALNSYGETTGSQEAFATIAVNGSCGISWNAVTGASTYKVYRSTLTGGETTSPALVTSTGSTSYTDTGSVPTSGAAPTTNTAQVPLLFPLMTNEYLGWASASDDYMMAQVQTPGTAGQITLLKVG